MTGPLTALFRLYFGRRIRADTDRTWTALEAAASAVAGVTESETGPLLSPGFWLHQAARAWRAELDARLRPLGLTPTQFLLLASTRWLERTGKPTQQAAAEQAGVDWMMTSKVVRSLAERGLLRRESDESDARALRLTLPLTGRTLTRQATAIARDVDAEFFGPGPTALRGLSSRDSSPTLPH